MKKSTRVFAVLLIVLLCLSLTGCKALDELRQKQGYWQEDGTILWNDVVYKRLETGNTVLNIDETEDVSVNVTKPDVPVLLSDMFGDILWAHTDGMFLVDWGDDSIYCRQDSYDAVAARIALGFTLDTLCYDYYFYDPNTDEEYNYTYTLTDAQKKELLELYETAVPVVMEEGMYLSYDYTASLYGCSEDGLLKKDMFYIMQTGEQYYMEDADNTYSVPKEHNPLFAEIMACAIEECESLDMYWE